MARCACPLSDTFCVSPVESLMRWTGHHLNRSVQDCFDSGTPGIHSLCQSDRRVAVTFLGQSDRQVAVTFLRQSDRQVAVFTATVFFLLVRLWWRLVALFDAMTPFTSYTSPRIFSNVFVLHG